MKKTFTILIAVLMLLLVNMPLMALADNEVTCPPAEQGWSNSDNIGEGTLKDSDGENTIFTYTSGTGSDGASAGPKYYSGTPGDIRFYAKKNNTNGQGNWMQINVPDNTTITGIELTASQTTTVKYNIDGGSDVSWSASDGKYSLSDISVTSSFKFRNAHTTNNQVRITSIKITYTTSGGGGGSTTYTLTYFATNGSISGVDGESSAVESGASVAEGAKVYLTATPSSASYAFKNWAVSGTGSTLYNVNSDTTAFKMGTADATVTAYFATPHNFSYSASNGSITVSKGRPVATNTPIAEGGVLNISATPTSGYRFKQWNVTGSGSSVASSTASPTTFTMGTADATLAAEFEAVYTVTYDANGATSGTVPTDATQYTSGTTVTVAANTGSLVKTGYDFGGWNTKADGTGTNYTAGTGTFSITANTTLFAKWEPETYTVAVASVADATVTAAYASSTIAEGESASGIAYGTEITLRADGLGAGKGIAWDVYKTGDATTKVTVTDNKFTVPTYDVTISGTVGNAFVKYTGDLAEGDYVIYATDGAAMKNSLTGANSDKFANQTTNISVSGNDMVITDASTEADVTWHIANISETSYWTMYNADEKKYAGSTLTKNTAALLSSVTDYAKWTYVVSDGVYDFVNYGRSIAASDQNNKYLRRNSSTGWASYATSTGTKPYLYKKSNTYQLSVEDVANITNTATPSGQSAIAEGGNAYVKPGVTVTLASTPTADYIIDEWDVYKTDYSSTKVTVTNNTFTMPDYAVTVSATTRAIEKVDVKYYVNDVLLATVNVTEGDELTLKTAGEISAYVPSGFTFAGWTDDEEDLSTLYTSTYTPVGTTNLYAVFTATKPATFTLVITKDNFTTVSYVDNNKAKTTTATAVTGETMSVTWTSYNIYQTGGAMQWKSGEGYIYNSTDLGTVISVTITSAAGSYTTYYGTTAQPSSGDAGTGKGYFKTSVGNSTGTTSRVEVTFVKSVARKFTRVLSGNISEDLTLNAPAIVVASTTCTVKSGYTLNAGNFLTVESGGTLIIEDGGQLVTANNASVNATVKKSVLAWNDTNKEGWNAISSPVNGQSFSDVANMQPTGDKTHNIYLYDPANVRWQEYRNNETGVTPYTSFTNGRGYLYRKNNNTAIEFSGALNTGTVTYSSIYYDKDDVLKQYNLIGNPYAHNITKGASSANILNGDILESKYCIFNSNGTWTLTNDGTAIAPGTAILVQAKKSGSITITNTAGSKGETANNDNIWFTVAGNEFNDVACVEFKNGHGFNKIAHRNEDAPMLYINHNGENFASVDMDDDTKVINLCFKSNKMGLYTLTYNAKGVFSYLHLIDKVTGEDVDMLIDDEYTFVGTPSDKEDRFIVKLAYLPDYGIDGSDTFAFQSGNEIFVSGEGELQIFDVTGRFVMSEHINGATSISADALSTGVYILRIVGSEIKTQKIVVR